MQRKECSAVVTVNKIDISAQLKKAETLLREDKTASPQLCALIELLVVIIRLLTAKLGISTTGFVEEGRPLRHW